jgi:hypothetical protein
MALLVVSGTSAHDARYQRRPSLKLERSVPRSMNRVRYWLVTELVKIVSSEGYG